MCMRENQSGIKWKKGGEEKRWQTHGVTGQKKNKTENVWLFLSCHISRRETLERSWGRKNKEFPFTDVIMARQLTRRVWSNSRHTHTRAVIYWTESPDTQCWQWSCWKLMNSGPNWWRWQELFMFDCFWHWPASVSKIFFSTLLFFPPHRKWCDNYRGDRLN